MNRKRLMLLCSLLFLFFPSLLSAQNLLGVYVSPDYNYRWLYRWENDPGNSLQSIVNERNAIETGIFGLSYGITYASRPKPNLVIEGGVGVCTRGEKTKWISPIVPDSVEPDFDRYRQFYKYHYLDLPMRLKWYFNNGEGPVKFFLSTGFTGHLLLRNVFIREEEKNGIISRQKTVFTQGLNLVFRTVTVSVAVGAGMEIPMGERLAWYLHPEFRYHVSSLSSDPIREFFWSAGLKTGFTFDLGN